MEEIICKNCGLVNDYNTVFKSNQKTAWCNGCGTFIKNIPHSLPRFYFGKYKGGKVGECSDMGYLNWFLENTNPKPAMKEAIINQIEVIKKEGGGLL